MFTRIVAILPPIILAAYSVLFLYAHNINELEISEILPTLGWVLTGTSLGLAMMAVLLRDSRKVGVIGSLLVVGALFYGLFFYGLDNILNGKAWHKIFFPVFVLLLMAIAWGSTRTKERTRVSSTLLLVLSVVLFMAPAFQIVQNHISGLKKVDAERRSEIIVTQPQNDKDDVKRSIYYLIFDRYAANRTLKRDYDFDNEEFLSFLSSKGFYVAKDSYANYGKTAHSLASSLNMMYLNHLSKELSGGSEDWKPLHRMIKDFEVGRVLKQLEYRYIHLGSMWGATRTNEFADEVYNTDPGSEFGDLYLRQTVFLLNRGYFSKSKDFVSGGVNYDRQCNRILYKFTKLNELAERKEQLFVFAHMLIPHGPYVFTEDGHCMNEEKSQTRTSKVNYVHQVKYVNKRIQQLVNRLLSSETKPIIIIQSDEGPFPESHKWSEKTIDWRQAAERDLQQKFRILNALYLPDFSQDKLYPSMTPVNTFRMILSEYFGLEYEHLADRAYSFYDESHLYDFFEVTNSVK